MHSTDEQLAVSEEKGTSKKRPPRPCVRLPLEALSGSSPAWSIPALEEEVTAAGCSLRDRSAGDLRVLTWNVWFDAMYPEARQLALLRETLVHAPDVICLQEVLPEFADALRSSAVSSQYQFSPFDVAPYGVLVLVRNDIECAFQCLEPESNMGRKLISATFSHGGHECVVMTSHFESLHHRSTRRVQLEMAASSLKACDRAVLCGDFNFDASQNWGDWRRPSSTERETLENDVLEEVLPEFCDTWKLLFPDDYGYTFDGADNHVCINDPDERMRYDRVLCKGAKPTQITRLGLDPINEWGLKASDHYGLCADFEM